MHRLNINPVKPLDYWGEVTHHFAFLQLWFSGRLRRPNRPAVVGQRSCFHMTDLTLKLCLCLRRLLMDMVPRLRQTRNYERFDWETHTATHTPTHLAATILFCLSFRRFLQTHQPMSHAIETVFITFVQPDVCPVTHKHNLRTWEVTAHDWRPWFKKNNKNTYNTYKFKFPPLLSLKPVCEQIFAFLWHPRGP